MISAIAGTISVTRRWLFQCVLLGHNWQVSVGWCEASSSLCGPAQFADLQPQHHRAFLC